METEQSAGGVAVATVDGERRALLIRVRKTAFEIPKGHIEAGESAQDAALREIREETNIESELVVGESIEAISYEFDGKAGSVRKEVEYFHVEAVGEPVFGKRPKGTREIRWVNVDELVEVEFVSDELRRIVIDGFSR